MIDLHSHILPGIDDGSKSLAMSLEMARIAVADGTRIIACTPHMLPGVYNTRRETIIGGVAELSVALADAGIGLHLLTGADVHIVPDIVDKLSDGRAPSLGGSRYFLFEPPHHVAPPGIEGLVSEIITAGWIPILTHPERLTWIEKQYELICRLGAAGAVIQLTAASITGGFGKRPQYWSQRMLEEGRVDIIASDAHDPVRRPPGLSRARDLIARDYGDALAVNLTSVNPRMIVEDRPLPAKTPIAAAGEAERGYGVLIRNWWRQ